MRSQTSRRHPSTVLREKADEGVPVLFSSHQLDLVERFCDRVGVVRAASMVACGSVEELCAREPTGLYVEIEGAPPNWPKDAGGVASYAVSGQGTVVHLKDGADERDLLRHAVAAGRLRVFQQQQRTLAELFRSYVSAPSDSPASRSAQRAAAPAQGTPR